MCSRGHRRKMWYPYWRHKPESSELIVTAAPWYTTGNRGQKNSGQKKNKEEVEEAEGRKTWNQRLWRVPTPATAMTSVCTWWRDAAVCGTRRPPTISPTPPSPPQLIMGTVGNNDLCSSFPSFVSNEQLPAPCFISFLKKWTFFNYEQRL